MKNKSDEELYYKTRKGYKKAFDELYLRYEGPLFTFIHSYLKNRERAEEVFHDVFVKIIKTQEVHFSQGRFKGWIYMIARNTCIDQLRKNKATLSLEEAPPLSNGENAHFDLLVQKDVISKMKHREKHLSLPLRELFQLKLKGLSLKEIAQILNVPVGTVKSRTHTMIQELKEGLESSPSQINKKEFPSHEN